MVLTSLVITFGISGVLLSLVYRIHRSHRSIDLQAIAEAESREEREMERRQGQVEGQV